MNNAAADIIESHEDFQGTLADATCAAFHLVLDPENDDAEGQAQEVFRFIHDRALPHMEIEETVIFARAIARGVPQLCLDALRDEHESLRRIAALIGEDEPIANEHALLLLEFLQAFEKHAAREEAVFSLFHDRTAAH